MKLKSWQTCTLLSVVVLAVYFPSLFHMFRSDHLFYLYFTRNDHSLWDLVTHSYSFNRVRQVDTQLFRPLLFTFMSLEKWAFGLNPFPWQLVGILLHATNCCLIFTILRRRMGINALFPALFFAVCSLTIEGVTWQHLTGYLVFCTLFLLTVLFLQDVFAGRSRLWLAWQVSFWSCFFYELGSPFCVLLFLALCIRERKITRTSVLFLLSSACYFFLNMVDRAVHAPHLPGQLERVSFSMDVFKSLHQFMQTSLTMGFSPWGWRIFYSPNPQRYVIFNYYSASYWWLALLIPTVYFFLRGRQSEKGAGTLFGVLVCLLFGFSYIIAAGRLVPRGFFEVIMGNLVYFYVFWCIATPAIFWYAYALPRALRVVVFSFLVLISLQHALILRRACADGQRELSASRALLSELNSFVAAHRTEPDFSFQFRENPAENIFIEWTGPVPDNPNFDRRFASSFFDPWMSPQPKYWIKYSPETGVTHVP